MTTAAAQGFRKAEAAPASKRPRRTSWRRKAPEVARGYALVVPALLLYGVFLLWPIMQTVYLSMTDWNGLSATPTWTGLENYRGMVGDERFGAALWNNVLWVIGSWFAQGLGLLLAPLLSATWIRGRTLFRTMLFVPATLSLVVVGIVWDQIYNPNTGLLNTALNAGGLDAVSRGWLSDENTAMPAVIATANWTYFGFAMVIFLAGLQAIDRQLYEAAALDGAGAWRQFRHITIPGLRNQITLLLVISFINTLRTFDLIYVMTNGGPGQKTEVVAYYIYSLAFVTRQVGYGAAVATTLTLLILAVTAVFLWARERD